MTSDKNQNDLHSDIVNRIIRLLNKEAAKLEAADIDGGIDLVASAVVAAAAAYSTFNISCGYAARFSQDDIDHVLTQFSIRMRDAAKAHMEWVLPYLDRRRDEGMNQERRAGMFGKTKPPDNGAGS